MISMISAYLVSMLLQERLITPDDREIYEYGLEITIANMVNGIIVFLIGVGFQKVPETIIFYLAFVSLRFFCGGYHADSYSRCFFSFALTNALCLGASGWIAKHENIISGLFFLAAVLLWLCIFKMAPLEHENRPFTDKEKLRFRKRSIQIYGFWIVIGIVLWMTHLIQMEASLISTFIAVAILMIGGKSHEKRNA